MSQANGESVAQYHFRLRSQAAKCKFPDINDAIRSKLLQTMIDGRLRREAMVKSYSLEELLKHAANKEDIDRQAKAIEQSLQVSRRENVNRIYEKKNRVTLNNVDVEVKENEMKRTVNKLRCVSIVEQVTKIKDPHARR